NQLNTITSISADALAEVANNATIIDVRKPGEYSSEHVVNAENLPLDFLEDNYDKLDKNTEYHIHCAGCYRSVIAISMLMQQGFTKLIDVAGGYGAIKNTEIEKTNFVCPTTLK